MYCKNCGKEIDNNSMFCSYCGCNVAHDNNSYAQSSSLYHFNNKIKTAVKVFMIIGCFSTLYYAFYFYKKASVWNVILENEGYNFINLKYIAFFCFVPLIWAIPMTIHYFNRTKNGEQVGTAFKVCTLIFVNFIAGILMLCDSSN